MDVRFVSAASILRPVAVPPDTPAAPFPGIAAALSARLTRDPGRPMITFYDDATGERVEFSTTTLDNWVAKTANLLVDTVGLAPGDSVGLDLPAHWTSCVILLAAWSAGMDVRIAMQEPGPEESAQEGPGLEERSGPAAADLGVAFVGEDRIDVATALGVDEIIGLSLRPLGGRMRAAVPGVLDYAVEVPPHGDRFLPPPPPAGQAEFLRLAAGVAHRDALGPDDRVLTAGAPASTAGLLMAVLVPLVCGASVVLCRHLDRLDPAALARRVGSERVSALDWSVPRPLADGLPTRVRRLGPV
ncbi:TIGR03089 family protein [Frankia sp. EI5c]|uniref:TIGR03089 family protein n=1 Tax=Frankia sp. EI5c TaxID=683316 RepID=UPI0007C2D155|nr:TIGR03089 family protein [Frankia sp. EI5c]OAA24412.1 TIGR03089 family protein [Frankia sp. EI5c]